MEKNGIVKVQTQVGNGHRGSEKNTTESNGKKENYKTKKINSQSADNYLFLLNNLHESIALFVKRIDKYCMRNILF